MKDPADNRTIDAFPQSARRPGRPRSAKALTNAERQARFRARHAAEPRSREQQLVAVVSDFLALLPPESLAHFAKRRVIPDDAIMSIGLPWCPGVPVGLVRRAARLVDFPLPSSGVSP